MVINIHKFKVGSWITQGCLEVERVHQEVVPISSMFMQRHGLRPIVRLQLGLHWLVSADFAKMSSLFTPGRKHSRHHILLLYLEKLQVLSFIFIPYFRRCPFRRILTSFALYREFCCMFCPLTLT
ncbi:hypothetical protein Hanom_Chr16g01444811 [Helianthus anomalus]